MRLCVLLVFPILYLPISAWAQGCPPGQYQIGGQGAIACAPIPQGSSLETAPAPRPLGKWISTWGAVAMGSLGLERNYGVTTGKLSKAEAESDALARCAKHGEKNCKIGLSYFNQCVAIGEPQIDGKPNLVGDVQFYGSASVEKASAAAQAACERDNPENSCKVVYKACTEQIFKYF
ncbi:DUF4189 domain-containing protein [Xanthomonas arboricola]|uniref:DUF4189 domain-containing protein n=4 Tax=Xanthomonas arboricola pv. pruni TaxID=69929 RepID=A0AAQ0W933_9XANT|nr:DUF4189 domain-containing protein [Xanthomonas arboricola]MDN0268520.1 DUF4189 domain-containing protein [Xanthomonas arboricola pv. pruni]MDN0272179.1 DUF4189 domain-containing protein [Xanthomonas arboricola pv. pruni]MDN0276753.1 DUF4189 domain-containing protein [Xanthomonas arboricola pv. pruni]MDN0284944.1 DUF4189 domain-containing protein [Xanthomonas arboricola pv. pruni]MDN0288379.1 DUF4189 domain-containing protein [Xanthomonas arboricola pv. pruni]